MPIKEPLLEVNEFLDNHPREFVIIDFQHFYEITHDQHKEIQGLIYSIFGNKILRPENGNLEDFTLDFCYKLGKQVLLVYRKETWQISRDFWPGQVLPNPWPNKTSSKDLENYLQEAIKRRRPYIGYVSQCILTPSPRYIVLRFALSLKYSAKKVEKRLKPWILEQKPGPFGMSDSPNANIFIADFIELKNARFCKWVVDLNSQLGTN